MARQTRGSQPAQQKNVVLSTRVSSEFRAKLRSYLAKTGKSLAGWLRESFEGQLDMAAAVDKAYIAGFQQGAVVAAEQLLLCPELARLLGEALDDQLEGKLAEAEWRRLVAGVCEEAMDEPSCSSGRKTAAN